MIMIWDRNATLLVPKGRRMDEGVSTDHAWQQSIRSSLTDSGVVLCIALHCAALYAGRQI